MEGRLVILLLFSGFLTCSISCNRNLPSQYKENANAVDPPDLDEAKKIQWLSKNTISIHSIDPQDDDFTDLMSLKDVIGKARIVMLGEASHGDGATICAKQRLVRFLHEAMGFDVLAWEAHFFYMEEINKELKSDKPMWAENAWIDAGLMKSFGQYSRATQHTARPLYHTGFDIIFGFPMASGIDHYRKRLFEFLDKEGSGVASPSDIQKIGNFLDNLHHSEKDRVELQTAIGRIRSNLHKKAKTTQNHREMDYYAKTLDDLAAYQEELALEESPDTQAIIFRSKKMGENLIWLANKWYPDQKIIVWAANRHVARNVSSIEMLIPEIQLPLDYREMGDFLYKEFGDSVYSVAFVTYQGSRGRENEEPYSVNAPSGSIESLWHNTNQKYGFVDFRSLSCDHWLRKPLVESADGGAIERSNWTNVFDGMFYINTMFPVTKSGDIPEAIRTKRN